MLQKRIKTGKYRTGKRCLMAVLVLLAMLLQMIGVKAEEISYQSQDGIVTCGNGAATIVIEGNTGQSLSGKQFQLHQLFGAENAAGLDSIDYTINPTYKVVLQNLVGQRLGKSSENVTEYEIVDYMVSMNTEMLEGAQAEQQTETRDGEYRYFAEALAEELVKEEINGSVIDIRDTKSDNTVEITGLPYGYYMVMDVTETEGEHTALSMPMLSTANPTSTMRLKADYPTMVARICEDKGAMWNDVGDFDVGQTIMYRYESTVPDMRGYQHYYHAWHTKLDEAITLQENSIEVSIVGTYNNTSKPYSLTSDEFEVVFDEENNSFSIEVEDFKAIVDREYGNDASETGKVYGQTVNVIYKAMLNEKAVVDNEVPAFEVDARLEFSNNPFAAKDSEHGFTPWDTVVCFTYQLKGQKVNNHGTKLEGAKFRLYKDKACTQEILVRKVEQKYLVMKNHPLTEEQLELATEIVSDEEGGFIIYGLDAATYYLKETEAPLGYRPLTEPIEIVLQAEFSGKRFQYVKGEGKESTYLLLDATAKYKTVVDGKESKKEMTLDVDSTNASVALSVVNHIGQKLPITGTPAILLFAVCGVSLIAVALLRSRKKHE